MEECSDASLYSNEEDIHCPGLLFRTKVFVFGDCHKAGRRLIDTLIGECGARIRKDEEDIEGVSVNLWYPFKTPNAVSVMDRRISGEEHHLALEIWHLKAKQVLQSIYLNFLTPEALYVITFDESCAACRDEMESTFSRIQQKISDCHVLLVSATPESQASRITDIMNRLESKQVQQMNKIKDMITENRVFIEKLRFEIHQRFYEDNELFGEKSYECLLKHQITLQEKLQQLSLRKAIINDEIYNINTETKKGVDEFKKVFLTSALNRKFFPHLGTDVVTDYQMLYDEVLKLREKDVILLPVEKFKSLLPSEQLSLSECLRFFNIVGGVLTLPTLLREQTFVCIYPRAFINLINSLLVEDDTKAFRFEYKSFWPEDTGFKHPDAQDLANVLNDIPTNGLVRESLLPLLWQQYSLTEEQIRELLVIMNTIGILVPYNYCKNSCEGLAMPEFPSLSVKRYQAVILFSKLTDLRPQLNWASEPFKGDVQITWRYQFLIGVSRVFLQQILGIALYAAPNNISYRYIWNDGALIKAGEIFVCIEIISNGIDVSCRGNADEIGEEMTSIQALWLSVVTFLLVINTFLESWPCLIYKVGIKAYGHQFYYGDFVKNPPIFPVSYYLSCWLANLSIPFKDSNHDRKLDTQTCFPFKDKECATSVTTWLLYIKEQHDIDGNHSDDLSRNTKPSTVYRRKRLSRKRNKKAAEIKWDLDNIVNVKPHTTVADVTIDNNVDERMENNHGHDIQPITSTERQMTEINNRTTESCNGNPPNSSDDEEKELYRLTSCLIASILASSIAQIIEEDFISGNSKSITAAQVKAAKATAEAAQAAHNGDIEGAAKAVVEAVQSVEKSKSRLDQPVKPTRSKTCVVV